MRLIDAEQFEKYVKNHHDLAFVELAYGLDRLIRVFPTVDAVPVIHAYWKDCEYDYLICSNCQHASYDGYDEWLPMDEELAQVTGAPVGTIYQRLVRPYYCGYCGAKMDAEDINDHDKEDGDNK